ncbi:hypothetical protein TSUD_160580 [Trifolium subterraneum]|uniref:Uncharacterized protein n=1 Tax=Trifolium subterraneum TaxID=3900 RepID=A0A2Z6NZ24_TRISU|nr:hypothetical protein TSUD_160580 [Trifolium subterraneum]
MANLDNFVDLVNDDLYEFDNPENEENVRNPVNPIVIDLEPDVIDLSIKPSTVMVHNIFENLLLHRRKCCVY